MQAHRRDEAIGPPHMTSHSRICLAFMQMPRMAGHRGYSRQLSCLPVGPEGRRCGPRFDESELLSGSESRAESA